jgi:hypothetical protein
MSDTNRLGLSFLVGLSIGAGVIGWMAAAPAAPADRMGDARATIAAATQAVAVDDLERRAATAAAAVTEEVR